ncbi:MAG TPA: C39 family peptidase [Candidatus Gordonibacter avicola]|nr:C39 family peptidase [Candidatus Gordonibacter avicola]
MSYPPNTQRRASNDALPNSAFSSARRTAPSNPAFVPRAHPVPRKRRVPARLHPLARRWKTAQICFLAALLVVGAITALPLISSSLAAADVDAAERASLEVARLEGERSDLPKTASFDVPALAQYPELPTGCESVALTNALISRGFTLQKTEIADTWLPISDNDFVYAFMGDPHDPLGNSCMAPAVIQAGTAYLEAQGSELRAVDLTGSSFGTVLSEASAGNPVICWYTINLQPAGEPYRIQQADGRTYGLYTTSHCVVVRGYDLNAGVVLVSDSLAGQVPYDLETFAARYYELGAQAVVIK